MAYRKLTTLPLPKHNGKVLINKTPHKNDPRYRTADWKRYSFRLRSERPRCDECGGVFIQKDLNVDHIIPTAPSFGGSFWDQRNHQVLCYGCHSKKTAREKSGWIACEYELNEDGEKIPKI